MHISLLDSGIGGLTLLNEMIARFPHCHYTYFADTYAHPYGTKSLDYLSLRINGIVDLLVERGADVIVLACNTASSVALTALQKECAVPVLGVAPIASPLKEKTLILCTPLTAKSEKLKTYVKDGAVVYANACLAPLIERYSSDLTRLKPYLEYELSPYRGVERAVLGCTHYVYLEEEISTILKAKISTSFAPIMEKLEDLVVEEQTYKLDFIFSGNSLEGNYREILARLSKKW